MSLRGLRRGLWLGVLLLPVAIPAMAGSVASAPVGAYLSRALPGPEPVLFAPDYLSTDLCERDVTFSPEGREIYYSIQGGNTFADWFSVIACTRQDGGRWSPPRLAPFSGRYLDLEPCNLGAPINSDREEFYPSLTDDGTLYFTAEREGGRGGEDIWRARARGEGFAEPENLGDSVNTAGGEYNAFIARDESYLLFGRNNDLYVSFRRPDGSWTHAVSMGPGVNSPRMDYCPSASPDGRYLFFTSTRYPEVEYERLPPGYAALEAEIPDPEHRQLLRIRLFPYEDLYWVRSDLLEPLRQAALR